MNITLFYSKETKYSFSMEKFLYGKKVLVTGSGSGIGYETARLFAGYGYTVYGVARSVEEKEEDIGKGKLVSLKMDVTDEESIKRVLGIIGDFSILIHSAGFGIGGSAEDSDLSLVRAQEETDYYGVLLLNSRARPVLMKNPRSLVIAVSSIAARVPLPFQGHYSAVKYALEAYMGALRNEIRGFGTRVAVVEPGDLSTGFTSNRIKAIKDDSPYSSLYDKAIKEIEKDEMTGGKPIEAARVIFSLSKRKNPPFRTPVGFVYKTLMFLLRFFPDTLTLYILRKMYGLEDK